MLKDEIEAAKRTVNTDRVQMTIGEVATMYTNREINILPDFQRLHRWTVEKKSNFIESILIGIPIPPIFVFETETGIWELVDGLQRISTILEFMGVLRDVDDPSQVKRSTLTQTKYLPSLKNVVWETAKKTEITLDKSLQLFFRRARLDFEILKHPSDPKTKYDLFQRLNRGGEYANEQEVRTCSMVLADANFTQHLKELASAEDFQDLCQVTEEQHQRQRDLEYLVRLIVHTFVEYSTHLDVGEYLSNGILEVIESNKQNDALATAKWVIETLRRVGGSDALLPPADDNQASTSRRFSLRAIEVIAVGVAKNRDALSCMQDADSFIAERIKGFWADSLADELRSGGQRGTTRIQKSVPHGEKWFKPNAQNN